jgi:hypothetical protein
MRGATYARPRYDLATGQIVTGDPLEPVSRRFASTSAATQRTYG